jgi:hypothetical protein
VTSVRRVRRACAAAAAVVDDAVALPSTAVGAHSARRSPISALARLSSYANAAHAVRADANAAPCAQTVNATRTQLTHSPAATMTAAAVALASVASRRPRVRTYTHSSEVSTKYTRTHALAVSGDHRADEVEREMREVQVGVGHQRAQLGDHVAKATVAILESTCNE